MEHQKLLRDNIKYIIRTNKISKDHLITPNINKIVDNVITDNTPIKKIKLRIEELFSVVQNATNLQLATIKEQIGKKENMGSMKKAISGKKSENNNDNNGINDNDDDDDDYDDDEKKMDETRKEFVKTGKIATINENENEVKYGESMIKEDIKKDELLTQILKTQEILENTQQNSTNIIDEAVNDVLFINKIESDAQKHHRLFKQKSIAKLKKIQSQKEIDDKNKEKEKNIEKIIDVKINKNNKKEKIEKLENRNENDKP